MIELVEEVKERKKEREREREREREIKRLNERKRKTECLASVVKLTSQELSNPHQEQCLPLPLAQLKKVDDYENMIGQKIDCNSVCLRMLKLKMQLDRGL